MKTTLNTYDIANALRKDADAGWSYNGAKALAEYLEELEESTGEEMELDVCAIRCDFSEFASLQEWAHDYFSDAWGELGMDETDCDDEEFDEKIREYVTDNATLIEFEGGVIVSTF